VLGEEEFLLRTPLEILKLRVRRFVGPTDPQESDLVRRAAFALRVGVEHSEPDVIRAAMELDRALSGSERVGSDRLDLLPSSSRELDAAVVRLIEELSRGRIVVERQEVASLAERPFELNLELPPLPPPPKEETTTFFEVRFVDEVGQAVNGLPVEFKVDGEFKDLTTNAAGVALLEGVTSSAAEVRVAEPNELESILGPRWKKARVGKPPKEANLTQHEFSGGPVGPVGIKSVLPNTVVITPPRGRLFVELSDKTGRVRHAERAYTISGPESFSGKTDAAGRLVHENVFPGDYTLKLTVELFEGKDKQVDTYESPLVVLDATDSAPEIRHIGVVPFCVLARLRFFFNTSKTFLLPTALPGVRALRKLYLENKPGKLLVVGHADSKGGAAFNDQLSLERAEATIAFLKDDVDTWLEFYESSVPQAKRWGSPEDRMMLISMPGFSDKPKGQDAVTWFQITRKLKVDGKAGPETRRQLITEYMGLDGAKLDAQDFEITAHGCGENFPLDDSGKAVETAPEDEKRDPGDRRVELFFFDPEFGIVPKPSGKNSKPGSTEYPSWRKAAIQTVDLEASELGGPALTFIELVDNLFRTNSAVVLPEGEAPSGAKHESLSSVGAFATLLRFNAENAGHKLLVAGHCDTTATVEFNQKLSEERAECALAVLTGNRERFKELCQARHTVADYKQILSWVSQALEDVIFDCDPGKVDDNAGTGVEPVRRFQKAYNANKAAIGATAPDLVPDGAVGKLTWGAFFDCYEFALQQELGEDAAGLAALREKLVFVDEKHRSLGFSEHFPIEELGVDHHKSQSNRRVELLIFQQGEEPDVAHAANDPETSEIYLPGMYRRLPLPPALTAGKLSATWENPTVAVKENESRRLFLVAPGLPPGNPVTFEVFQIVDGALQELTATLVATSNDGGAEAVFDGWYNPELIREGSELPAVTFRFVARVGDRVVESDVLAYGDELEVTFRHRSTEQPVADALCRILTPWAVLDVPTDKEGVVRIEGIPPGGARLVVRDFRLVAAT
jgi:outer membrane protein OmpA-like peptidoglycan-associated protein